MVDTNRILKDLKKTLATAPQEHLDYFYISVKNEDTASGKIPKISTREPVKSKRWNDTRWHTLEFKDFAKTCETSGFNYLGVDWLGDIQTVEGRFNPRWCREYQRKSYARIYSFAESCAIESGCGLSDIGYTSVGSAWFVTLTCRHPVTGSYSSMKKCVEDLRGAWNKVRKWIAVKGWRYLRVMEPGEENGYPHFHMVIVGALPSEIEELKSRWVAACNKIGNTASMKGQKAENVENIRNVGAYISKYVSKSFRPDDTDNSTWWRWMELCYREHIRVYAMDKKTSRFIKRKYPEKPSGVGEMEFVFSDSDMLENMEGDSPSDQPKEQLEPPSICSGLKIFNLHREPMDTLNGYPLGDLSQAGARGRSPPAKSEG